MSRKNKSFTLFKLIPNIYEYEFPRARLTLALFWNNSKHSCYKKDKRINESLQNGRADIEIEHFNFRYIYK